MKKISDKHKLEAKLNGIRTPFCNNCTWVSGWGYDDEFGGGINVYCLKPKKIIFFNKWSWSKRTSNYKYCKHWKHKND